MKGAFEITLLVVVLLWMQPLKECRPTKCPLANNIAKYGPNGEIVDCVRCPNCPIGQGLSYACGSKVANDSKIECVFCEPNKTYSDEHGIGHCKQCQDCSLRNVIQECSIYQKRECGNICPKGYVFHDNIEECLELESEPSTTLSTHSSKDPSRRERTGTQLKTELADEVTTTASSYSDRITVSSNQPQFPSTGVNKTPTQGTSLKENDDTANVLSTKDDTVAICVLAAVVVLVVLVLVIIVIICRTRHDHTPNRHEESTESAEERIPLKNMSVSGNSSEASVSSSTTRVDLADVTSQDRTKELLKEALLDISTDKNIHHSKKEMSSHPSDAQAEDGLKLENIPADILVSRMEQLCEEKDGNMLNYVKKRLDASESLSLKTWPSVGRELKLDADTLNLIGADITKSPTECLLGILKTSPKEPTMREFVQALKKCERYDIAKYICNWPWKVENI